MRAPQFLRPQRYLSARLALGLAMAAVAALSAWAFAGDTGRASADTSVNMVISSTAPYKFSMPSITIDPGTTVRWTAQSGAPHSITSDGCGDPRAGACTFDS